MLVLMGQFLDHDITLSPESEVALERCCVSEQDRLSEELQDKCFAVRVPEDDTQFNDRSTAAGDRQASSNSGVLHMASEVQSGLKVVLYRDTGSVHPVSGPIFTARWRSPRGL